MFARNLSQCGHCVVLVSECTLPTSLNNFSKSCGAKLLTYPTSIDFPCFDLMCIYKSFLKHALYSHSLQSWVFIFQISKEQASCAHSNLPDIFHTLDTEFSLLLHPHYQWKSKDLFSSSNSSSFSNSKFSTMKFEGPTTCSKSIPSCITWIPGLGTNSRVLRKFLRKQLHWPLPFTQKLVVFRMILEKWICHFVSNK